MVERFSWSHRVTTLEVSTRGWITVELAFCARPNPMIPPPLPEIFPLRCAPTARRPIFPRVFVRANLTHATALRVALSLVRMPAWTMCFRRVNREKRVGVILGRNGFQVTGVDATPIPALVMHLVAVRNRPVPQPITDTVDAVDFFFNRTHDAVTLFMQSAEPVETAGRGINRNPAI